MGKTGAIVASVSEQEELYAGIVRAAKFSQPAFDVTASYKQGAAIT